jgi:GNAT superfamily N-acetyltransferase
MCIGVASPVSAIVRPALIADIADVASLVERYWAFESIDGFDRAFVGNLLADLLADSGRGACWVAEAADSVCGYLLAVYVFSLEHGGMMGEIDELFVLPAYRSAGTGSALVRAAERGMVQAGIVRVQLQLGVRNERGRVFYDRHGFRPRAGYELWDKSLPVGGPADGANHER